jgi:RNA polymerase sigma factor (sigma-70 family)
LDEFDKQFDDLYRRAYAVAYKVLGDRGDAEDIAQESLARANLRWAHVRDFAGPWVARVSGNLAVDRSRRRARTLPTEPSKADTPVDERLDLQRALRGLSRRQREVVVLRYLADMSEADVARALRCSVGTVKTHASRGLAALRAELGDR